MSISCSGHFPALSPTFLRLRLLPLLAIWAPLAFSQQSPGVESKPLSPAAPDYSLEAEAAQVSRLRDMLRAYQSAETEAATTQPSAEEMARREQASADAARLAQIPYNPNKVRLSGSEGSLALVEITRRLSDPQIPESRRDTDLICSFRTYLYGSLIAGEKRSLRPVGKHHYLLKQRLQPGNTTVRISGHSWELHIPEDSNSQEYLITLYKPPGGQPEFHVFPVTELLAADSPHIPAWLPDEFKLKQG